MTVLEYLKNIIDFRLFEEDDTGNSQLGKFLWYIVHQRFNDKTTMDVVMQDKAEEHFDEYIDFITKPFNNGNLDSQTIEGIRNVFTEANIRLSKIGLLEEDLFMKDVTGVNIRINEYNKTHLQSAVRNIRIDDSFNNIKNDLYEIARNEQLKKYANYIIAKINNDTYELIDMVENRYNTIRAKYEDNDVIIKAIKTILMLLSVVLVCIIIYYAASNIETRKKRNFYVV